MITVPNKQVLFALPRTPQDNELAVCEDTQQAYVGKNGKWEPMDAKSEIKVNLYEINKTAMAQMKPLNFKQRLEAVNVIDEFCGGATSDNYYMLLCKDLNYYTIFTVRNNNIGSTPIASTVLKCAENMGQIVSVEKNNDMNSIEIWVKDKNDAYCMIFFDYTAGVVPVKV